MSAVVKKSRIVCRRFRSQGEVAERAVARQVAVTAGHMAEALVWHSR